ncbi:unnamed protein product [Sphenostylis stenocarpa]|uniref:Uncharacterized protein n=1 Tax=Sphenostylis stenocarpa TaxID=92480 RepID=A0AA86S888_9FABA|nr:unnamed protein product [Sphenostylis stenocarpa]
MDACKIEYTQRIMNLSYTLYCTSSLSVYPSENSSATCRKLKLKARTAEDGQTRCH